MKEMKIDIHDKKALREKWGIEADKGCFKVIDINEVVRRIEKNNQDELKAIFALMKGVRND